MAQGGVCGYFNEFSHVLFDAQPHGGGGGSGGGGGGGGVPTATPLGALPELGPALDPALEVGDNGGARWYGGTVAVAHTTQPYGGGAPRTTQMAKSENSMEMI